MGATRGATLQIPEELNIAELVCGRHARSTPEAPAVIEDLGSSGSAVTTFADLDRRTDQVVTALRHAGIGPTDRVALLLPQGADMLASLLGTLKLGAIAVPIALVHGSDGIAARLDDSGARVLLTDMEGAARAGARESRPSLEQVIVTQEVEREHLSGPRPTNARTRADDAAVIFYTSGSSGAAKGVVLAHRLILAQLPGFRLVFDLAPRADDVFWTPSEWSWLGGLQVVLAALYFGRPVVACAARFSPENTYRLLSAHGVTCAFLVPSALRRMRTEPPPAPPTTLRAIMTGGEAHSPEVLGWARETFGCSVNDDYGLTEANDLAVGCGALFVTPDGSAGRPVPGRRVAVIDDDGKPLPPRAIGEIAVDARDPVRMLRYWNKPNDGVDLTGGWFRTGDVGRVDEEGFLYVLGRRDQLILVSGYRVGPEEVETHLLRHESVAEAGVTAVVTGDGETQGVGACIVLRTGFRPTPELAAELRAFVKRGLASYACPCRLEFVERLPTLATGKMNRSEIRKLLDGPTQVVGGRR